VHFEKNTITEESALLHSYGNDGRSYLSTGRDDGNSEATSSVDSGKPLLPLVYLYRGLFIQTIFVIPIGLWWIAGIRPTLIALGQGERLSTMTEEYLRILTPGLWSYSISWTLTAWLQAVGMADIPAYAAAVGLITHVPFNLLFIYTLQMGYLGCAMATTTFQLVQPILMVTWLFVLPAGRARILQSMAAAGIDRHQLSFWQEAKLAVSSARGILQYLGLAVPGIIIISEWWASEVAIFLAGTLTPYPELALGAMSLYQSINSFCYVFPTSFSVAGSTRIGNLLGAGRTAAASWASVVSVISAGSTSAILGCILLWTPHETFPSIFAPGEADLIEQSSRLIPLLSIYLFADGIQSALNGIIKGCGRQRVIMPIVVVAYWVVGLPLAYYLAFVRHAGVMCDDSYFCGDIGLVVGMTVGTWTHMLLLLAVVVGTTDWEVEAKKAKERLDTQQEDPHERRQVEHEIATIAHLPV